MTSTKHTALPWHIKHMDICGGPGPRADRHLYIESVPLKKKGFIGNVISVKDKDDAEFYASNSNDAPLWLKSAAKALVRALTA